MVLISTGAVVLNLRVAAAHLGFGTALTLHADTDQTLAAEVTIDAAVKGDADLAGLYPSLARRRTNRGRSAERAVPLALQEALVNAAVAEDALLDWRHT